MAIRMPNAPKVRVPADIYLQNGAQYTGQVFVAEPSRIQDLLNSPKPFLPFID
jgi:sRNA-binding regulator protein Hfq